ncbi:MAG: hypothetical protein GTO63_02495 [Anaerolineae bacterium]|nr:hypothetical protein [Anaerolineae bacterium]
MLDAFAVRLIAVVMAIVVVAGLLVMFRWEMGGRGTMKLRASTPIARGANVGWTGTQMVSFFYPVVVAIVPGITYGTVLNFSFPYDSALQLLGIFLWCVGAVLLLWCSRLLGSIMTIDGVAEGHKLMTRGPFATIRHPTYTAWVLLALGAAGIFLSYVLLVVAVLTVALARLLASREEQLLASPEGFGEEYRAYMKETGRFLPKLRSRRRSS